MAFDLTDPLASLGYNFNANDPNVNQLLRQRIALQMMASKGKAYPKNIGEGLASIGESISNAMMGRMMLQQDTAARQAAYGNATAPAASAPGQRSEDTTQPSATPTAADTNLLGSQTAAIPPSDTLTSPTDAQGISDGGYNVQDAAANNDFKFAGGLVPGDIQDHIASVTSNPNAQAYLASLHAGEGDGTSSTGASGPFQFTRGTGAAYGLVGPNHDIRADPKASAQAALQLALDNAKTFEATNGRKPTYSELALMHQQGGQTGANMVAGTGNASPDALAVNNVPPGSSPAQAVARISKYYGMGNQTADLSPGPGTRDSIASTMTAQQAPPDAQDAQLRNVLGMSDTAGAAYPATASREDITSDAPQPGLVPRPMGPAAGAVPTQGPATPASLPINPTMPPAAVPPSGGLQPAPAGAPPEAANNRPIASDIQPMPVAPGTQTAQAQLPSVYVQPKPVPPPAPQPVQMPQQYWDMVRQRNLTGNPYEQQNLDAQIKYMDGLAAVEMQNRRETFQKAQDAYNARQTEYQASIASAGPRQLEQAKAASDLATQRQAQQKAALELGPLAIKSAIEKTSGQDAPAFFTQLQVDKTEATKAENVAHQASLVRQALDNHAITGTGANLKVDVAKIGAFLPGGATDEQKVIATERLNAAIQAMYSAALENLQPGKDGKISGRAYDIATGALAADPQTSAATLRSIIADNERVARNTLNSYETKVYNNLGSGTMAENFRVPQIRPIDQKYIKVLEDTGDTANFDKRFGENAAMLEKARLQRARNPRRIGGP